MNAPNGRSAASASQPMHQVAPTAPAGQGRAPIAMSGALSQVSVPLEVRQGWLRYSGLVPHLPQGPLLSAVLAVQSSIHVVDAPTPFTFFRYQDSRWSNQVISFQLTMPIVGKISRAVWQVSTFPFPTDATHWDSPPGLVKTGSLPAVPIQPAVGVQFPLSIAWATDGLLAAGSIQRAGTQISGGKPIPWFNSLLAKLGLGKGAVGTAHATPPVKNYYVRVVVLGGQPGHEWVMALSNGVTVQYGAFPPPPEVHFDLIGLPSVGLHWYAPVHPEQPNAQFHYLAVADSIGMFGFWKAGDHVDLTPHDDNSFLDDVADDISDAINAVTDFFEAAVNWISAEYNGILNDVVGEIASLAGCSGTCEAALRMAVNVGLSAIGIPPSLPNFDQLVNMGTDYLIAYAAEETGVPSEAITTGVNALKQAASSAAAGGGGVNPLYYGLKPDPAYQFRPAMLMLTITPSSANNVSQAVTLHLTETGTSIFEAIPPIIIPALPIGHPLDVPVLLRQALDPNPQVQDDRQTQYQTGTTTFKIAMTPKHSTQVLPAAQVSVQPATVSGPVPSSISL